MRLCHTQVDERNCSIQKIKIKKWRWKLPKFYAIPLTFVLRILLLWRSHLPFKLIHVWIISWFWAIKQFHFKSRKTEERFLKMEGMSLQKSVSGRENDANKCSCDCFKIHRIGRVLRTRESNYQTRLQNLLHKFFWFFISVLFSVYQTEIKEIIQSICSINL